MTTLIRFVKWALLVISLGWAAYSANAFIFLARAFPSTTPDQSGLLELLASAQGYAIVFGPFAIAAGLLLIRWPEHMISMQEIARRGHSGEEPSRTTVDD